MISTLPALMQAGLLPVQLLKLCYISLVPSPTPSFPSLAVRYRYHTVLQATKAGRGTGYEANATLKIIERAIQQQVGEGLGK